jgi:hypothetical protein
VLYEMLAGCRAFSGDTALTIMAAIVRDEPKPLEALPALQNVVARCLRKSPADRFQLRASRQLVPSFGSPVLPAETRRPPYEWRVIQELQSIRSSRHLGQLQSDICP